MINKLKVAALVIAIVVLAGFSVNALVYPFFGRTTPPVSGEPGDDNGNNEPGDQDPGDQEPPDEEPVDEPDPNLIPRPKYVRGLYLSGNGAGHAPLRDPILKLLRETELNALVIDVRRDDGYITYRDTNVQLALDAKANANFVNMRAFMEVLREEQIYPIARIVVAKDNFVSKIRPDLFLQHKDGGVWKDKGGLAWGDMRNQEYWDYLIDIAIEAAEMGFREIQWDYVRFPSGGDGNMSTLATSIPRANMTKEGPYLRTEIIASFIAYSKEKLAPYNVAVTADTFGIMGTAPDEQSVGQQLELMLGAGLDVIKPMIYPGHFAVGTYGQKQPNRAPYEMVYQSTKDHLVRMEAMGSTTIMRPWLQDFVDHADRTFPYGVKEIHAQIKALEDLGVYEFLFWNARNVYTWEAYKTYNFAD